MSRTEDYADNSDAQTQLYNDYQNDGTTTDNNDDDDEFYDDEEDDDDIDDENDDNNNRKNFEKTTDIPGEINFMNEEEEERTESYSNKHNLNKQRLEYLTKRQRKEQQTQKYLKIGDEDSAENGSGYSSNHEDEDDDEEEDIDDDDPEFFASRRKTNNGYFRKNTNDAIKIISTPNGKVGIVYQQTPIVKDESLLKANEHQLQQEQKITPVLTADGKVALLYRGASTNLKYQPILNVTLNQNFNTNKNNNDDNKTSAAANDLYLNKVDTKLIIQDEIEDLGYDEDDDNDQMIVKTDNPLNNQDVNDELLLLNQRATIIQTTHLNPQLEIEYENSILPNINRPLSEVLGIKKNQFKQFRIKDIPTTTTTTTWLPIFLDDNNDDDVNDDNNSYDIKSSSVDYNVRDVTEFNANRLNENVLDDNDENVNSNNGDDSSPISSSSDDNDYQTKNDVINLAIIPHFDEEFELMQQRYREQYASASASSNGLHHHHRYRYRNLNQDLKGIHCIMQAMMGLAAISTIFGMLGAFFKQRIIDQLRTIHW